MYIYLFTIRRSSDLAAHVDECAGPIVYLEQVLDDVVRERPDAGVAVRDTVAATGPGGGLGSQLADRKSTRLNSSHVKNSYAVFCLKKKKKVKQIGRT